MRSPVGRVDGTLFAGFASATGLNKVQAADLEPIKPERMAEILRFVKQVFVTFEWDGATVYLTATDAIALATGATLLIRFIAWALSPLAPIICKPRRRRDD